jgi:hypothetical protein
MTYCDSLLLGGLCDVVENTLTTTEQFEENEKKKSRFEKMMPVIKMIVMLYAIYLSFRCKQKVDFQDLALSVLFSPCYILYRLAVDNTDCTVPLFSTSA